MLIYDLGRNFSKWVPMRGISFSLTSVELKSANDLNNICPYPHFQPDFSKAHSPQLVHGVPTDEETDTDSWNKPSDSEEWDEPEHSNWSCCPTPPLGNEGLMWGKSLLNLPR